MAYDNRNRGTLGRNKRREQDTHPEYAGQINVDGVDYWLSGWVKENKQTGEKFFSLSVRPKDQKRQERRPDPAKEEPEPFDDSIPF